MKAQRLLDLKADGETRIKAGERLLKYHGDVIAGDGAPLPIIELQQVFTIKGQTIGRYRGRPWQEAHDRQHGDRLAGTRFTDDGEHLSLVDAQGQLIHRAKGAVRRGELDRQIADFQKGHML